ncbi:hypothetical protein TRL7639_01050 [Falsiruegeria litorea R37]|uniref:DUF3299 domain-containing protein n=1 Tax=Falsiruegeria litorea R37 TaxID=1200284 RepID=A0A1Y5S1P3_9RHOB|nr:DUF3299 domain-containing protein [Falsiruegeria litorea]SLN27662.1 hypothetical protein TRL7639_01050 [Falsiruegeria litorea R37]
MLKFLSLSVLLLGATVAHAERGMLDWADLIDEAAQSYEDPYRDLSAEQLTALVEVATMQSQLAATLDDDQRSELTQRLTDVKVAFAEDGIDADWLIAQRWVVAERRRNAAWAGDQAVDGQTVTLGGYAIPAPADQDGVPTLYLVPERGMCSHMPPPPPNQMVRVRLVGDWRPKTIYEPVRLTGQMTVVPTEREVIVVDGPVRMQAAFTMEAIEVEPLAFTGQTSAEGNAWAEQMAQRLRGVKGQDLNEN